MDDLPKPPLSGTSQDQNTRTGPCQDPNAGTVASQDPNPLTGPAQDPNTHAVTSQDLKVFQDPNVSHDPKLRKRKLEKEAGVLEPSNNGPVTEGYDEGCVTKLLNVANST